MSKTASEDSAVSVKGVKRRANRRRHRLDDWSRYQIEALAKGGWFSYRFIASLVLMKPLDRIDQIDMAVVAGHCHRNGIRVMDGRNGLTTLSQHHAKSLVAQADRQFKHYRKTKARK